jgi:hypothetical protein
VTIFDHLDYLYTPSRDVAADARYFTEILGGRLVFAIEAMGTRVAMVELDPTGPRVLVTDHLEGDQPVLVYRVAKLRSAVAELESRGWSADRTIEIPVGPCCTFRTPGGHRLALYERSRPGVEASFEGRQDF